MKWKAFIILIPRLILNQTFQMTINLIKNDYEWEFFSYIAIVISKLINDFNILRLQNNFIYDLCKENIHIIKTFYLKKKHLEDCYLTK